jgi:hypothetical protein
MFYDSDVDYAGTARSAVELDQCVRTHPPTGSPSQSIPAIGAVVEKLGTAQGLYLLVFTKHLAVDEVHMIHDTLRTRFPKAHPSTLCVHLIDTGPAMRGGSGMSLGESLKLEATFNDRGPSLLRYQSSYSPGTVGEWHTDRGLVDKVIENLDRMFIGVSDDVHLEEREAARGATNLERVRDLRSNSWFSRPSCSIGFLPLEAHLALEFAAEHPPTTEVVIRCSGGRPATPAESRIIPFPYACQSRALVRDARDTPHECDADPLPHRETFPRRARIRDTRGRAWRPARRVRLPG